MLPETKSLEFGEFLLDVKEKVLLRDGERLPINPKTYQLLVTLIEKSRTFSRKRTVDADAVGGQLCRGRESRPLR